MRVKDCLAVSLVAIAFAAFVGCGGEQQKKPDRVEHIAGKTIAETITENRQRLLSTPGVVKVEPGDCGVDSCIKVYVEKKTDILLTQLPMMLETWRVDVVEIGQNK